MTVRDANETDLNVLYEFEQEIIRAEREFDSTLKKDDFHYYDFKKLINSENAKIVVIEVNNQIIGSGFAEIKNAEHYLRYSQYAYIGLMYIRPSHRGQGINSHVLQTLKKWILKKGVTELRLVVYKENEQATSAYKKAGFIPHVLEMRMEI